MVAAAVAPIRRPLPFTQMGRGVAGRKRIVAYFAEQIPIRRARGGGNDLFSQLCQATHEDGALLSTQDIIDHMSFLMMAAHDTLTSSLTSFVGELAAHPEWQQQLREEVKGLGVEANDPSSIDNLEKMPLSEMAFKEALRLKPPVPSMPRRAVRNFSFRGYDVPAGTLVGVNPLFTHHMPEFWAEPEKFNPWSFTAMAGNRLVRRGAVVLGALCARRTSPTCGYMFARTSAEPRRSLSPFTSRIADVADPNRGIFWPWC